MSPRYKISGGPQSARIRPWSQLLILLASLLMASLPCAQAHDLFTAYIQHRVAILVGAKHVDVTVQLTFFEEGSEHEREHIDTNHDARLSRAEIDEYLQKLEPQLAKAVTMKIGGHPVNLMPLRTAELDLLGHERVGRAHHRLTLYFFAPTPGALSKGTELLVEDRLWPETRALGTIQVEGKDGCRLEALSSGDSVYPPAKLDEARPFRARVLTPPTLKTKAGRNRPAERQFPSNHHGTTDAQPE